MLMINPASDKTDNGAPATSSAPSQTMPPQQQDSLLHAGLDLACQQLLDEISLKVMLESDDGLTRKTYSPPTEEELADYRAAVSSIYRKNHFWFGASDVGQTSGRSKGRRRGIFSLRCFVSCGPAWDGGVVINICPSIQATRGRLC